MKKTKSFFLLALLTLPCLLLSLRQANAQASQEHSQSQGSLSSSDDEGAITSKSYCDFLNATTAPFEALQIKLQVEAASTPNDLYDEKMGNGLGSASLLRFGTPGNYFYELAPTTDPNISIHSISWNDAMRYCEWKNSTSTKNAILTWNLNNCDSAAASIDPFLKSNLLTFCLVSAKANQASGFGGAVCFDAESLRALSAVGAVALFGGGARGRGRPTERTSAAFTNSRPFRGNNMLAEREETDFTQTVLSWRLGSIKDQLEGASSATPLALTHQFYADYYNQFVPLILEEARAAIEKGLGEKNRPFKVKIKQDVNQPRERGNPWIMNLEGAIPEDQKQSGSMNVLLLNHKSGMKFLVLANEKKEGYELKAKFSLSPTAVDRHRSLFNRGAEWGATYVTSLITHQRQYEACLKKAPPACLTQIVTARIPAPINVHDHEVAQHIRGLNASQQRAVQNFIAAPSGVTLLQGPPGTGKTTTIVSLLRALCHKNQRTLVCAPSNKAVQVLAERYLKDHPDVPVILAGVESKISDELRPIFLHTWRDDLRKKFLTNLEKLLSFLNPPDSQQPDAQKKEVPFNKTGFLDILQKAKADMPLVEKQLKKYGFYKEDKFASFFNYYLDRLKEKVTNFNFSRGTAFELFKEHIRPELEKLIESRNEVLQASAFKDDRERIEKALLNRSKIIFATLSVTGRQSLLDLKVDPVNVLIVDEAGQSVEAETLIPFQHMPAKVLLVGDTKQLPATVMSQHAKEKGYDRSMMERLEQQNEQRVLMLDTQYRMDPQICAWPSNRYYNGRLQTHSELLPSIKSDITQPIAFYDISTGQESKNGTSRKNDKEADYVLQIIRHIRKTDTTSRIGIITFYAAQVDAIKDTLKRENETIKQKVTVNTVDGFQGDEREIIILSSVCANNRNDIGFLNDPRRLNVAITRAKNTLIVLGRAQTLESQEGDLKVMISNLKSRGKLFSEQQLNQFLGNEVRTNAAARKNKANNKNDAVAPAVPASIKAQLRSQSAPTLPETISSLEALSLTQAATTAEKKNNARAEQQENKASKKKENAIKQTERKPAAKVEDAVSKSKQKAEVGKKARQPLAAQTASKLTRIENPSEYYTDDDMKDLGEMLLPADVDYIPPAVAAVPSELRQAIGNFIDHQEKQRAIIAIHSDNHFTGVCISKNPGNRYSIIYFDPVVLKDSEQPMHQIPGPIFQILKEKFPDVPLIKTSSEIQTYTVENSGGKKVNVIDNNHCGPFVLCIMTEMAKGNLKLKPNKKRCLQVKDDKGEWTDIPRFDQTASDVFGELIRKYHAELLSGNHDLNANEQLNILRSLCPLLVADY